MQLTQEKLYANKVRALELMVALEERKHHRQFNVRHSYAFAWLMFGFMAGGWLVAQI